jgi:hypothetical protein
MYADQEYKNRVREIAIEVAQEQGWCKQGLNEVLRELGIAPAGQRVRALIRYEVEVEFDVPMDNDTPIEQLNLSDHIANDFDNPLGWTSGFENIEVMGIDDTVEELEEVED